MQEKYLSILAGQLYFINLPNPTSLTANMTTFDKEKRLILTFVASSLSYASKPNSHFSDVSVHGLSVGMLLLAFFITILQLVHRRDRRGLQLLYRPGTLASVAALTVRTPMAELLDGRRRPEEINRALKNRRFRMDPQRMKIVTEDEPGYDDAVGPTSASQRESIFDNKEGSSSDGVLSGLDP
jgi:hypothetical protein